jgi:hypothetical protein
MSSYIRAIAVFTFPHFVTEFINGLKKIKPRFIATAVWGKWFEVNDFNQLPSQTPLCGCE